MSGTKTFTLLLLPCLLVLGLLAYAAFRHSALLRSYTPAELRERLTARDEETRYHAVVFLAQARDRESVPALAERVRKDPSHRVRARAAHALGLLGDVSAAPALLEALAHTEPEVLSAAVWSLGQLGSRETVPAVEGLLGHPHDGVRWNAAVAAARMGSHAGLSLLRDMASSDVPERALTAVRSLALIGEPADAALLRGLPDRPWENWKSEAEQAAVAIESRSGGKR